MYQLIDIFKTTAVIDSYLNVTDGITHDWRHVYRFDLVGKLLPGDLIEVHADHEFTNPGTLNTALYTAIGATNSGQWYDTDLYNIAAHSMPNDGFWIAPPAGGNIDAQEHHRQINRSGMAVVPADPTFTDYTCVLFKAFAYRQSPGGTMNIEGNGYGSMFLKQYRSC